MPDSASPSRSESEAQAVLIALPKGAGLSGITTWAGTLARGLAALGHDTMVLVHDVPGVATGSSIAELVGCTHTEVRVLSGMPPIDAEVGGGPLDDRPEAPAYVRAVVDLSRGGDRCVVAIPTYSAECFGLFAAMSRSESGRALRTIGWCHNDIAYDRFTLSHYRGLIHRFVGVSSEIVGSLRAGIGERANDVRRVPYGVPIPAGRDSARAVASAVPGPLRLVYTGRMDTEQKRVLALVRMSGELTREGVEHELVLVGDGPAAGEVDAAINWSAHVRRVTASGPSEVAQWLAWADVFVLASRYEGLSLSMLEAMAHGCALVVTRVSGAIDAVGEGPESCGVVVDAGAGVDDPDLPRLMAEGVRKALEIGIDRLKPNAHLRAQEHFSESSMARAVSALCHEVALEPPRTWPSGVMTRAGDFTVPSDAAERCEQALLSVGGAKIALWGAGRHTRAVLRRLGEDAEAFRRVVCVLDDAGGAGPGSASGPWPVVGHAALVALGVTDVVISSALHEDDLWRRRGELERLGIRVHRVYGACSTARA